jgi:hypothetical protein
MSCDERQMAEVAGTSRKTTVAPHAATPYSADGPFSFCFPGGCCWVAIYPVKYLGLVIVLTLPQIAGGVEDDGRLSPKTFVTAERFDNLQQVTTFADTTGRLWTTTRDSLLEWDGETRSWKKTPVGIAPRPRWTARPAPPWNKWACSPVVVPGREGSLLVVVVSDVYQRIPEVPETNGRNWRSIIELGEQLAAEHGRPYWLDAWLYRNGDWSERALLRDLLKTEKAYFVRNFTEHTPRAEFFDLQVVGDELWWTDGPDIHVLNLEGKTATWQPPNGQPRNDRSQVHGANFVLLADGTLWYVVGGSVTALRLTESAIESKPQPGRPGYHSNYRNVRVTRNGSIWQYGDHTRPYYTMIPWLYREGEWICKRDLGPFAFEDLDGGMWFMPGGGEGTHSARGYNILKDGTRSRLPLPGHFYKGTITAAGNGVLLAAGGDRIVTIVRSGQESGWAVRGVLGVKNAYVVGPVWVDAPGNLVSIGWNAELPKGRLP